MNQSKFPPLGALIRNIPKYVVTVAALILILILSIFLIKLFIIIFVIGMILYFVSKAFYAVFPKRSFKEKQAPPENSTTSERRGRTFDHDDL